MYEGLKEYLEEKGYSQTRMAEMLGVSLPYVNAILVGNKTLGKKNANKWANLFGLSENYLLTGKGSPDPVQDAENKKVAFQETIQKANRLVAVLNYLVDEGRIENFYAVAPILHVTDSVIHKAINHDPEGQVDFVFVKLTETYRDISLPWLLTGEGEMIIEKDDEYRSYMDAKLLEKDNRIEELENELSESSKKIDWLNNELQHAKQTANDRQAAIDAYKELVKHLQKRLAELENNSATLIDEVEKFPFPVGSAEPNDTEPVRV